MATRRITRDQRNLLLFAGGMLLAAVVLVAVLLIQASARGVDGSATNDGPVEFGSASAIAGSIQTGGPRCYPDLAGGSKPLCLTLLDGHLVAVRALAPGTADCPISVDRRTLGLVDCRGAAVDPHVLDQFAVTVAPGKDDTLSVDLRQLLAPRASTPTSASTSASASGASTASTAG